MGFMMSFAPSRSDAQETVEEFREVTSGSFTMNVPTTWREMKMPINGPLLYFTADGRDGLPVSYNGGPLIVTIVVVELRSGSLVECQASVVRGYNQNPDRIFESDTVHRVLPVTLPSGDSAYSVSTRFYRTSKALHQNRYDLVVFSEKAKIGYMVSISIQHNDQAYNVEKELGLREYVDRVFATADVN